MSPTSRPPERSSSPANGNAHFAFRLRDALCTAKMNRHDRPVLDQHHSSDPHMFKKFISIKNIGKFRNSAAGGDTALAKRTLIVGANGFGKTTLCAVLRSLKTGDPSHLLGRKTLGTAEPATVDILLQAGTARFDGNGWSAPYPALEIFDGVFVAENIHSGEVVDIAHKRNLYRIIIGEKGVSLADQDSTLAAQSREKTSEITTSQRAIQSHVPKGMEFGTFVDLPIEGDVDELIATQQRRIESIREAEAIKARASLAEIPVPTLPSELEHLLGRSIEDVGKEAESLVADHLQAHDMTADGGPWIAKGIDYTKHDSCPFCGQSTEGLPLIAAYRAIFSERYRSLESDIESGMKVVQGTFGEAALARLATIIEQNKASIEFWRRYCTFDESALNFPTDAASALQKLGVAATTLLERKQRKPLESISPDEAFAHVMTEFEAARTLLDTLNLAVRTTNAVIAAKKAEASETNAKAAEDELILLKAIKARHSEEVAPLCTAHAGLVAAKEGIDTRRSGVRQQLDDHTKSVVRPYESRINELLGVFNAGFSIAETRHSYPGGVATSSYQLVINNTGIDIGDGRTPPSQPSFKNTLSSGDRTTLALAFFIADLERDPALSTKTIVFDDPFNSQDAFRRRQTVHEIARLSGFCEQVIVLSHDATFCKQIWDKSPAGERTALVIADHRAQGSKLLPIDLEKATQGRTATDIDDLQSYLATGAGNLLDVIRKMRVVLETYCRTTYPASFDVKDWLGDIVGKIRAGGAAHVAFDLYDELDQLNDYTKQYHHGEDVSDQTPDQIDPTELTGYVRRTLKIVNALQA
jgi:wobble nucleotide-excising tRNase